jgi:hypothetical protein
MRCMVQIPHTISHTAQKVPSQKKTGRATLPFLLLEPVVGVEPTTCCLRNSCSATELHRRYTKRLPIVA